MIKESFILVGSQNVSKIPSEMEAMRQTCMFLTLQFFIHVTSAQVFEISRPTSGMDVFNIPLSTCGNPHYGCSSFYGVDQFASCSCLCPASNATFAFADNRWMCMANLRARDNFQAGKGKLTVAYCVESSRNRIRFTLKLRMDSPSCSTIKGLSNIDGLIRFEKNS